MEFARLRWRSEAAAQFSTRPAGMHSPVAVLPLPVRGSFVAGARRPSLRCTASQSGGGEPQLSDTASGSGTSSSLIQGSSRSSSSSQAPDHYKLAGQRLQNLLAGVGDGEEEFVNGMIMDQTPEQKMILSVMAGGIITVAAFFICWLFQLDPFGGASLSLSSLQAAAIGGLASLPLVALKAYLWSEHGKQQIGWVEDWHRTQVECFKPLMNELNPAQTALFMASEVVPGVLILLPAAMGGIEKALALAGPALGVGEAPVWAVQASALITTAAVAGVAKLAENVMTIEEYEIIKETISNADRYYKVMATNRDSDSFEAQRAADAFRAVALTWMARSQLVGQLAATLTVVEVALLGVLWHETGDLAAPMAAALAASSVDFAYIRRQIMLPQQCKQPSAS